MLLLAFVCQLCPEIFRIFVQPETCNLAVETNKDKNKDVIMDVSADTADQSLLVTQSSSQHFSTTASELMDVTAASVTTAEGKTQSLYIENLRSVYNNNLVDQLLSSCMRNHIWKGLW